MNHQILSIRISHEFSFHPCSSVFAMQGKSDARSLECVSVLLDKTILQQEMNVITGCNAGHDDAEHLAVFRGHHGQRLTSGQSAGADVIVHGGVAGNPELFAQGLRRFETVTLMDAGEVHGLLSLLLTNSGANILGATPSTYQADPSEILPDHGQMRRLQQKIPRPFSSGTV